MNITKLREILKEREESRFKEGFSIEDIKGEIEFVIQIFMKAFNKLEAFTTKKVADNSKEEIFTCLLKLKEKIDEVDKLETEENGFYSAKNLIIDLIEGKGYIENDPIDRTLIHLEERLAWFIEQGNSAMISANGERIKALESLITSLKIYKRWK